MPRSSLPVYLLPNILPIDLAGPGPKPHQVCSDERSKRSPKTFEKSPSKTPKMRVHRPWAAAKSPTRRSRCTIRLASCQVAAARIAGTTAASVRSPLLSFLSFGTTVGSYHSTSALAQPL